MDVRDRGADRAGERGVRVPSDRGDRVPPSKESSSSSIRLSPATNLPETTRSSLERYSSVSCITFPGPSSNSDMGRCHNAERAGVASVVARNRTERGERCEGYVHGLLVWWWCEGGGSRAAELKESDAPNGASDASCGVVFKERSSFDFVIVSKSPLF